MFNLHEEILARYKRCVVPVLAGNRKIGLSSMYLLCCTYISKLLHVLLILDDIIIHIINLNAKVFKLLMTHLFHGFAYQPVFSLGFWNDSTRNNLKICKIIFYHVSFFFFFYPFTKF